MPSTRSMDELILHTAGGVLYFGTGRPQAAVFDRGPQEFVAQEWVRQADSVRILGTADNASLIVELHNHRLRHGRPQIYLGSPSLCRLDRDPPDVIRQLMEIEHPPSVGGWHKMRSTDYTAYALINEFAWSGGELTERVRMALEAHPAYRFLQFIPTLDDVATVRVLCEMRDPRFHVDPKAPDAVSRLKQFFGLGEPGGVLNANAFLTTDRSQVTARYELADAVLAAWSGGWEYEVQRDVIPPRCFLMRVVRQMRKRGRSTAIALLRASHVFLRYLRYTWLDAMTPPREYELLSAGQRRSRMKPERVYAPTMFVPEHFFANADEVAAWHEFWRDKK